MEFEAVLPTLSVTAVLSGAALSFISNERPAYAASLERWGGLLIVVGLALLGTGLGIAHPG